MGTITQYIASTYCPSWGFWEGVRELIQNAKDAEEFDNHEMQIEHFPRTNTLVISNKHVVVPPDKLHILGESSKQNTDQRGQFGEGFLLGTLALVRAGHPVTVYNGDEVWRPSLEEVGEGPFAEKKLLRFHTRKLQSARDAFTIEIENVSKEVWAATKKLFLFLSPPATDDIVQTKHGTALLGAEYHQKVFARGIYVNTLADLECGYDVNDLKLDRDRRFVDEYDLKWKLPSIWNAAYELEPAKFLSRIYDMAERGRVEVKELSYRADEKLIKAIRAEFERENGAGTVPVRDMRESKELSSLGAKTAVVDGVLADLLSRGGISAADERGKLESAIVIRHDWSALTDGERDACDRFVELLTKAYVIVTFAKPTLAARLVEEEQRVAIARWVLSREPRLVLEEVVRPAAALHGCDPLRVVLDRLMGLIERNAAEADIPVEAASLSAAAGGGQ